jgi:hypothetical protein
MWLPFEREAGAEIGITLALPPNRKPGRFLQAQSPASGSSPGSRWIAVSA